MFRWLAAPTAAAVLTLLSACPPGTGVCDGDARPNADGVCPTGLYECTDVDSSSDTVTCWVLFSGCNDDRSYRIDCEDDGTGVVACRCRTDGEQVSAPWEPGDFCSDSTGNVYEYAETYCGWEG